MKIYISEKDMHKHNYCDTYFYDAIIGELDYAENQTTVTIQSLEQLKQEVRREFAEKVKASVSENSYTVYYNKFSSDNGMTEDGFAELIDNLLKQYEVEE